MPALMDRKMDVIQQRQLAPVQPKIEKQECVESHPADKLDARYGLPIDFRQVHLHHGLGASFVPAFKSTSRILAGFAGTTTVREISLPSLSMATVYVPAARLRKIYAPVVPVLVSSKTS